MKKNSKIEIMTLLTGLRFPESPVFDFEGRLWFVEIHGGNLSCWNGQQLERFDVQGKPNGATIDSMGNVWFCDSERGEIRVFYPSLKIFETKCIETVDGTHLKRPNDLIFDAKGNLIFSDHADGRDNPVSTICVLPADGNQAKAISSEKYFTNGLALSANGKKLIFAETYNQCLWVGDWDADQLVFSNERVFAKAGNGPQGPDGIAFDEYENIYVTVYNESKILVFDSEGNQIDRIYIKGKCPTSCAFDPAGKLGLVVTEAERGEVLSIKIEERGLAIFYK